MTRTPPLSRRRTRGLAALVVAGAAFGALSSQAVAAPATAPSMLPYELPELQVAKTAETSYDRYWSWDIDKTPSTKVGYNHENNHVRVGYKVTATPKVVKTGHYVVRGTVSMTNPAKPPPLPYLPALGMDLIDGQDLLEGARCDFGGLPSSNPVLPGATATIDYTCIFDGKPDRAHGVNTVKVEWKYKLVWPHSGAAQLTAEDTARINPTRTTYAKAPYDFRKGETEEKGYTTATVWDKMDGAKRELLGKDISALDGVWMTSYTKYLKAPVKVNDCRIVKNRASLKGNLEQVLNGEAETAAREGWDKAHADAYVKICTKERNPSSEDPRPPVVDVTPGSSEDPAPNTPAPTPKPADVKPSDFDPKDPPSSEDPKPNGKGNIEVSKRANKKKAYVGSRVVWKIRVSNTGGKTVKNVLVRDRLPKYFRATKVLGRKKGVTLRPRNVRVKIAQLRPGQSKTIRIVSRVVGRPQMNKPVKLAASKKRGKARKVYVQRMKRGIACNVVLARGKRGGSDRGEACLRVLAPKKSAGPSKTEVAPPSNGSGQGQEIV